jgi:predicted protein tyrosine phosphatase
MKRVLFVCDENRLRSPTAERIYMHRDDLEIKSAGVNFSADKPVIRELLEWADIIFVMERRQRNVIHKRWPEIYNNKQIICLYIDDDYDYMDPVLINALTEKLIMYLGEPSP